MKKAFITGANGQDGSYLSELLESKGYEVHGFVRRSSQDNLPNLKNTSIKLHYGDMTDSLSLYEALKEVMPDEVYNLAAQSFVKMSFITPIDTADSTALGCMRILEILRQIKPDTKFYQAGSSEMYGNIPAPQSLEKPFSPISPYSVAKIYSHYATKLYRDTYGMFCVNGVLFNHESPRRGIEFLSRKVAIGVAEIVKGKAKELRLGNLSAKRDWGHAKDYVRAIYMMMQHDKPEEWLVASGESHTVEEFVIEAFKYVNLDWQKYVVIDDNFKRPNEVNHLQGDSSKIRDVLGWKPEYSFQDLVREMVESELIK